MATKKKPVLAVKGAENVRRETFDGLPIVDAEADMIVVVRNEDIKRARGNEKDAEKCALAKACARDFGSTKAAFFRTVAYIELPDENGNRRVVRFILGRAAAEIVRAFDRRKSIKGEVAVRLKAPSRGRKLDYVRDKQKANTKRKREAILKGKVIDVTPQAPRFAKKPNVSDIDVRNGSGLVQNVSWWKTK